MIVRWRLSSLFVFSLPIVCGIIGSVAGTPAAEDHELELLKEIYRNNLLQDLRHAQSLGSTNDDLEAIVEQRARHFLHDHRQQHGRARRQANDAAIEADTAEARYLYLKGFRERGHVPVNFPVDICLLRIGKSIFAAALHQSESSNRTMNATAVSFYRRVKGKFEKYLEHQTVTARHFDCISIAHLGFVAVVNYHDHELDVFEDGSPVFQVHEDGRTEIVQTFGQPNQNTVHLWIHAKYVYLTHTYINLDEDRQTAARCPVYRWTGYYFDVIDHIPCYNAVHIEAFSIDQQMFVAVANQMSADRKDTYSVIFQLNPETLKLNQHQQIYSYSVSHIAYFFFEHHEHRDHFLITGNSRVDAAGTATDSGSTATTASAELESNSIVYKLVDGYFVPFQNLELTGVKMFLPVVHENGEFLLLVLCTGQPLLIYEYDGWKLVPSRIDYTGEAFAAGVSRMRVYRHIVNASVIAIANSNLFGKSVNLFTPQYGVENDLQQVYAHFIEWCERMHDQMSQVNLEELYNRLLALPDVASKDSAVRTISKNVELHNSTVGSVRAGTIQTEHLLIDDAQLAYVAEVNEYVQLVKEKMDLVEQTIGGSVLTNETVRWSGDLAVGELIAPAGQMKRLDVKVLNNAAHKQRHAEGGAVEQEPEPIDSIEVDRLIVDRIGDVRFWNGHAAESLLLTDDDPARWKELSVTAKKVVIGGNLFVNKLIDGIFFHPSNVLLPSGDQVFSARNLLVQDLRVNRLTSGKLNSSDAEAVARMMDQSRTLLAKARGAVPDEYGGNDFDTIDVDELTLKGLLNSVDPRYLTENVLLADATDQQMMGDKLVIEELTVDSVELSDAKLSGVEWDKVARTTGEQQILQDLQFTQPLAVDSLQVRDRLNHIPMVDGKLQVLLLASNETQTVTGTKTFDHVTLLSPIELQGKINGDGLNKMNPIVTIEQDLVLDGDYTIHGNVSFGGPLGAHNIYGHGGQNSLQRLVERAVRLTGAPGPQQTIKFLQPVFVENLHVERINELAMQDLVLQNADEMQYLTGRKTFVGDLAIDGVADANEINKVDLNQLNRTIFRRDAEQTIEGSIHFARIVAPVANSQHITLGGKPIDRLLRLDVAQNISGPVRFENCTVYVGGAVTTQYLQPDNTSTVYGYDLEHLFRDTLVPGDDATVVVQGTKSFRNVSVGQLVLLQGSTFNGVPLESLQHILAAGDNRTIVKQGPYGFTNEIVANQLLFEGTLNGIPKEAFCRAWLMYSGNQTFTVGQTFERLAVEQLHVSGTVNGVRLQHVLENAYRTDREEYIEQAIFHGGLISYEPSTVGGLVSGLNLSSDVLLKQSSEIQTLDSVQVTGTLQVKGQLHILNHLNGIHFPKMMEFFGPKPESDGVAAESTNIEVHGNVHFEHAPTVIHLNGHNVQKLYGEVWLPHRPTVLTGKYHFESVEFFNAIHTNDQPINHLHWGEVEARCLSGKRPQNITAPLVFENDVVLGAATTIRDVDLKGLLKSTSNSPGIDVQEYEKYVFRYHEDQEISGNWFFHDVEIKGRVDFQYLNGLNIETDLLRTDVPVNNVTATKHFRELHVDRIVCAAPCTIQDVDMDEWFANALRLKGNQTIEGTLRIEDGVFTGGVEVLGLVNGVPFDADHLLLKSAPQNVNGTLTLITKFPSENKIFPLLFESLHASKINGKNVSRFLANVARNDQSPVTINTPVTLVQPLEAEETLFEGDLLFGVNVTELIEDTSYKASVSELTSQVRSLNSVNEKLVENIYDESPVFSHFDRLKTLAVKAVRMLVLTVLQLHEPVELLVVQCVEPAAIDFYHWSSNPAQPFTVAKSFPSIVVRDRTIVNMKRVRLGSRQHLFVEFYEPDRSAFTQQILDTRDASTGVAQFVPLYVMNSTRSRDIVWLRLVKLDCIVMYAKGKIGFEVRCVREENLMHILDVRQLDETLAPVQMVALENHVIILDNSDRVQVWRSTAKFYLKHHQTITASHPSYLSVARYENQLLLAINSEHTPNTAHHGSIEIWRKTLSANGTFAQHQLILTKLPKQLKFSVLPTKELLLYTLTENWLHPLVVYRYEGVTGFREVLTSNTIRQQAVRLSVLKFRAARKEIVAIVGPQSTDFVDVVFV
ncbi:uncharacterized protein LOC128269484 [Anopheles cruzii]|uniref:uncharacterized protein LOC128269484 n=1 Tax=Anopheles cruzii TaxID=68878 RepID=UPI0022EC6699|nr:uncharacterized protein LOC128269484 [Anopheles cruzii]